MISYIDESKNFYKANLHCHTTKSDGRASVEDIKREYMAKGYSIVAFTDHEHIVDNSYLSDGDFLAITGCELSITQPVEWNSETRQFIRTIHINLYALDEHNDVSPFADREHDTSGSEELRDTLKYGGGREKRVYSTEGINALVKEAHELGFLVSLNHPAWSLINAEQYLKYEGFDFLEIHNTGCVKIGMPTEELAYDVMLKNGKRIMCTATDDNHNSGGFSEPKTDSFGGWVVINADALEYGTIMDALKNGSFYASTGPEIYSMTRDGDVLTVKTSPCKSVAKLTEGRRASAKFAKDGEYFTEVTFKLSPLEKIFRIRVTDEHGKCAYTQPYDV